MAHVLAYLPKVENWKNWKNEKRLPYQGVVKHDWVPTGRIDFATRLNGSAEDAEQPSEFKLLVEERRIVESIAGNENLEIQWRLATLKEDAWSEKGFSFLERQSSGIGGGTTEMARNNIAEKVLKMPREITHDKNMPFRDVPKGPPGN